MATYLPNRLTIDSFHQQYPELDSDRLMYGYGLNLGDVVKSKRLRSFEWRLIAIGGDGWNPRVLIEMPTTGYSSDTSNYWSYGMNEHGENVIRRIMLAKNIYRITKENNMCQCKSSYCYCDSDKVTYEINAHADTVEVTKGRRTISLTLGECTELASFLATAKTELKTAKLSAIAEQQAALDEQKAKIEAL